MTRGPAVARLAVALADAYSPAELDRLAALVDLLAELSPPPDPFGLYPEYPSLREALRSAAAGDSAEALEQALLELYAHLHGHAAPYSPAERAVVDRTGGYWAHAGGLAPILKAPDWLRPDSCSADLGAGNGLQLLLVQRLAPHRRTVQIEISQTLCAAGRELQRWLGIPAERVEWRAADVTTQSTAGIDFLYLYRPVKPEGDGIDFYRRLAAELTEPGRDAVVFSVADCLGDLLAPAYERFSFDGHLACFRRSA